MRPANFPNRFQTNVRGQDNRHEGLYLDDFIVGLAGRGEQGLFSVGSSDYGQDPSRPSPDPNINVGRYDLEIRRGTDPLDRVQFNPYQQDPDLLGRSHADSAPPTIWFPESRDFRDRLDEQMTLFLPNGWEIVEGETFRISDGLYTVTFEFDSDSSVGTDTFPDGSIVARIPITFSTQTSAGALATAVTNAINTRYFQTTPFPFKVRATASGTDGRVELINASTVGESVSVSHSVYLSGTGSFALGDQNQFRDQGYTIISNNTISDSSEYNILVDSPTRDQANQSHPSSTRNLREVNSQRLVPGISIFNNQLVGGGTGGIHFSGEGSADGAVPFGRIVNNTIYGDKAGIGILVDDGASPTILNNIFAANSVGLQVTNGPGTVLGSNLYQSNGTNVVGDSEPSIGGVTNFLAAGAPLFVDAANRNFYLEAGSKAIDSAQLARRTWCDDHRDFTAENSQLADSGADA